jgi:hypothetical protein
MSYVTGWNAKKIKTYSWDRYIKLCSKARDEGYEIHKASSKRDWPRFWRRKYKAQYRRYYIIDDSKIAYFPKTEIERIKTGVINK